MKPFIRRILILGCGFFLVLAACSRSPRTRADWADWWQVHGEQCRALEVYLNKYQVKAELMSRPEAKALLDRIGAKNVFPLSFSPHGWKIFIYGEGLAVSGWGESVVWRPPYKSDDAHYDEKVKKGGGSAYKHLEGDWYAEYLAQ